MIYFWGKWVSHVRLVSECFEFGLELKDFTDFGIVPEGKSSKVNGVEYVKEDAHPVSAVGTDCRTPVGCVVDHQIYFSFIFIFR